MPTRKKNLARGVSLLILLPLLLLGGCKKAALYHQLSETEAHEIIVALYEAGIHAEKERELVQNEVFWTVEVGNKYLPEARRILIERSLPRKEELGLSGVYKEKGLIPTPDEQKARFLLAVKGEIVNSLEKIPEVVDADVVINIPTPEEFTNDSDIRPTASVVLKVRPEDQVTSQITEAKIQQFVANSIEDLNPRDVSVIISYLPASRVGKEAGSKLVLSGTEEKKEVPKVSEGTVSIAGLSVSKESAKRLRIYLAVFFALLLIMSAVLIVNIVRTTRMRQEFKALSEGVERPLIEGEVEEAPRLGSGGDTGETS